MGVLRAVLRAWPRLGHAPRGLLAPPSPAMAALRAVLAAALAAAMAGAAVAASSSSSSFSPPLSRNVSVLLEPGSGRLRVLPGRRPAAVAWASLDDRISAVG